MLGIDRLCRRSLALIACLSVLMCASAAWAGGKPLMVLCTTFPMYQFTRNIAQGHAGVQVELLLPAQLGCPHDYVVTPQDMRKLARADVLVVNGLGLEEFLGAPLKRANPRLRVIESAQGITAILRYGAGAAPAHDRGDNPHLFVSPRMAALLVRNIAEALQRIDPAGAGLYERNASAYAARLNQLADECVVVGRRLASNRIVTQHGAFDYLARDMGLTVVAVVSEHAEPSAAQILELVRTIRRTKAGAVFTEPQYPVRIGQTIAREAGIRAAELDPAATGPADAGLDYYETIMRRNLATLEQTLGKR